MIYCVMASGPALTQRIRDLLFNTAQDMFADKIEKKKLDCAWCEGYVYTKWKQSSMGYIYGVLFTAHFSSEAGTFKIEYIVRETDMRSEEFIQAFTYPLPHPEFSSN